MFSSFGTFSASQSLSNLVAIIPRPPSYIFTPATSKFTSSTLILSNQEKTNIL